MSKIRVDNLSKVYVTGKNIETPALSGITLEIEPQEFLAIAGTSGSGKTTLLNLIGSLDAPTAGTIHFGHTEVTGMSKNELAEFRKDHIGFVFQAYNLINTLTALENVEYIMLLQGVAPAERRRRAADLLTRVGLEKYLDHFPNQMSGGQQQRVAVARAIVSEPSVILADEPTANLDSKTSEQLLDLMLELNREKGTTFVFSTHDPMVIGKVARVVNLKDGRIAP